MAVPRTYALLKQAIGVGLQDSTVSGQSASYSKYPTAELDEYMADALREISEYSPYLLKQSFDLETRTGTATATTANALVDTTESQFVSGDTDKVIFNTTDNTWAIVTAYVSTSQLTLSKDIMASGEGYEIYNKNCYNNRQVNIEDVTDWGKIRKVEFPVNHRPPYYRNWTVLEQLKVLELDIDFTPDDSGDSNAEKEVYVYFDARHRVSQMTDFAGAVDLVAGYAAGSTSMVIDALGTGTFEEDTLFTIASVRGVYRATADATITGNEATVSFNPPLLDAAVNDDVVTIVDSTLNRREERLFIDLATARALIGKTSKYTTTIGIGGQDTWQDILTQGERRLNRVLAELRNLARGKNTYVRYNQGM